MTSYRLVYGPLAQRDLEEIVAYIARDHPGRAHAWIHEADRALKRLAVFPKSGLMPRDDRLMRLGYRLVVLGSYLAFYTIHRRTVEVRRVLHGSQRYSFLL